MTLHKSIELVRKFLALLGTITGVIIIIFICYSVWLNIQQSLFPKPPPAPTMKFGILQFNGFPNSKITIPLTYNLNTITGKLPIFPDRINVYKLAQVQPNLLGSENAKAIAIKNGFLTNAIPLSDYIYKWTNVNPQTSLTFNIFSNNFIYKSDYLNNPTVLLAKNLPTTQQAAIDMTKNFISNFTSFPPDINNDTAQMILYSIKNNQLIQVQSISQAQVIRIDLFQQDVDKTPIYYSSYPSSTIYSLIASIDSQPKVVEANFDYAGVLTDFSSTYQIKTALQAYTELENGRAYIARYDSTSANVNITNVSLGYYIGNSSESYLIPIIVFSGDNNFYAFVNAITDKWINISSNQQ